jgi:hypothetical protein
LGDLVARAAAALPKQLVYNDEEDAGEPMHRVV